MYMFSSRFGLVMTFAHEKKKFAHPNTRTQFLKVCCKKKLPQTPRIWWHLVLFNQNIKTLRFLLVPETKRCSRTEPNSPGSRRPHGVWFSETRLLLRLQEPLSQDHTALLDLPLHLGVKSKGTRMGDHDSTEVEVIKDSGWWPHWPTWRMFTGLARETPPEESALNDSFYAHTHASFTHLKNGATLSAKALFYCLVKTR